MRNVEIKAKATASTLEKARDVSVSEGRILQLDTFFETKEGRFKLRNETKSIDSTSKSVQNAYLIQYSRPDQKGAKLSTFHTSQVEDVDSMMKILDLTNGILGEVRKERDLFIHTDAETDIKTRIHIDNVHGLGMFMELEVMLRPNDDVSTGERIADELKEILGVRESDLITNAYFDMMNNK